MFCLLMQPSITIRSTVTNPGGYVFMAHYYQPHYVGFGVDVEVLVDNKQYKGMFDVIYKFLWTEIVVCILV